MIRCQTIQNICINTLNSDISLFFYANLIIGSGKGATTVGTVILNRIYDISDRLEYLHARKLVAAFAAHYIQHDKHLLRYLYLRFCHHNAALVVSYNVHRGSYGKICRSRYLCHESGHPRIDIIQLEDHKRIRRILLKAGGWHGNYSIGINDTGTGHRIIHIVRAAAVAKVGGGCAECAAINTPAQQHLALPGSIDKLGLCRHPHALSKMCTAQLAPVAPKLCVRPMRAPFTVRWPALPVS